MKHVVFLWENFGPYHVDRLNSVSKCLSGSAKVWGIELAEISSTYMWKSEQTSRVERVTLAKGERHYFSRPLIWQIYSLLRVVLKIGRADFFFCHYERIPIFIAAIILRLAGRRVYVMNDMKFSDFKRNIPREIIKSIFHSPYCGAIAAGRRSADYFRFLGVSETDIKLGYGAVSIARLDAAIENMDRPVFSKRPFIIVSRFVPMKNLFAIIDAYRLYRFSTDKPRQLHICGSGPLEGQLREVVKKSGFEDDVVFRGFLQAEDVTKAIASSLCLILLSTQETFGNVIIESLALGIPVIASPICGATDEFLRSGSNGFLVEPDNIDGLAKVMRLVDSDEERWTELRNSALEMRSKIDIVNFSSAVCSFLNANSDKTNKSGAL